MNFSDSEFSLGRQRCREWVPLVTQQLRLRHVYQIYALNLQADRRTNFFFTLHNTPMSAPFYTSEKSQSRNPKWNELVFKDLNTACSSVVIRIWKSVKCEDEILLTWGVNFSGLVYLTNKLSDLQPKYFKANTVIFFIQGGYFTSQEYLRDIELQSTPFCGAGNSNDKHRINARLFEKPISKSEIQCSYNIEKLMKLQDLQRQIIKKKQAVQTMKEKINENGQKSESHDTTLGFGDGSSYNNNVRFAPQLLTMNSLNKMLREKPTKKEREEMAKLGRQIEDCRFRVKMLNQVRDRMTASLRKLKQEENKLVEQNEEKNSNLMSLYHSLSRESQRFEETKQRISRRREVLLNINKQLYHRKKQLIKELLFIYPIEKIHNENKYTMLGIYLPDSELLTDYQDPGVSVVLGYICHILIMCSIFLQVPLRYPMKHFGSRSVIYDYVSHVIPDKDREFPLYTKGRDRAHFGYAVFLLNKNLSQLRWYFYRWYTLDMKETLKHLLHFLLGKDLTDNKSPPSPERNIQRYVPKLNERPSTSDDSTNTMTADSSTSLDTLVSVPLSSASSSNLNDPILDRMLEEIRQERRTKNPSASSARNPTKKLSLFKSSPKRNRTDPTRSERNGEALALPEAYLNRQISKDLFQRCASRGYSFADKGGNTSGCLPIQVRDGIEEFKECEVSSYCADPDLIEQGTDPLDPSSQLDSTISRSIDINTDQIRNHKIDFVKTNQQISRSADSYSVSDSNGFFKAPFEIGSEPSINVSCDNKSSSKKSNDKLEIGTQRFLEQRLANRDSNPVSSNEIVFPDECLRMSLQDISIPLTARTERLLSSNHSFNLVRNRPLE